MARIRALLLPLLSLAACAGGESFEGTFIGTINDEPVTLILKEDGKTLSGTIRWGGVEAKVSATSEGDRMTGTVRQPEMGFEAPFEATLNDDTIDWVYTFTDEFGQKNRLPLFLTREGKAAPRAAEERHPLDPQLIGRWHREVTGTGPGGTTVRTRVRRALHADGTYEYGDAESPPGASGPTPVTRGRWKTDGQVLYSREAGQGQWVSLGRYVVSGGDLVMYPGDGSKQVWSRE